MEAGQIDIKSIENNKGVIGSVDRFTSANNIHNSIILQDVRAKTIIVKNGVERDTLTDQEAELLRIYNLLPVRQQIELMAFTFDLEDRLGQEE